MSGQEKFGMNKKDDEPGRHAEREIAGDLKSVEARLASLSPRPDRLDRDRLMFLAGQASMTHVTVQPMALPSARRQGRAWPAAFAAMSVVAATLLAMLLMKPVNSVPRPLTSTWSTTMVDAHLATDHFVDGDVFSTRDAHRNIERLLARDPSQTEDRNLPTEPVDYNSLPVLTPAGWDRAINDSDSLERLPTGAFGPLRTQGART